MSLIRRKSMRESLRDAWGRCGCTFKRVHACMPNQYDLWINSTHQCTVVSKCLSILRYHDELDISLLTFHYVQILRNLVQVELFHDPQEHQPRVKTSAALGRLHKWHNTRDYTGSCCVVCSCSLPCVDFRMMRQQHFYGFSQQHQRIRCSIVLANTPTL